MTHHARPSPDIATAPRVPQIAVLGLGYVGLPLAAAFAHAGVPTLGFDIDPAKIHALAAGQTYLKHLGDDFAHRLLDTGCFEPTADPARLAEPDALLVCVPTPLDANNEPDLSFVTRTAETIAAHLHPGQLVILESTTYPGTTRDILTPILETSGLKAGSEFFVAYSPERENPGGGQPTATIPKLVGGLDDESTRRTVTLYERAFASVVPVRTPEVAEAAKLLENIYRAVNIALVNEMKLLLGAMDIDIDEVIEAAATKPFGFARFDPGPGLGGHCIPIDPFYLAHKARQVGRDARFIELAGQINCAMPAHVTDRLENALKKQSKTIDGSHILILGLAYKKNIDDVRESPAIAIIELLRARGASVDYHDPHIPKTHKMRRHNLQMESIALTLDALATYDAVVIATDHDWYDTNLGWEKIAQASKLIIDTRNALNAIPEPRNNIVKA